MLIKRAISEHFLQLLKQYPVVTVMGPRQAGKTTLVRTLCQDHPYINLENPEIRELAARDPKAIFDKYPGNLIIDEIQHVPSLLSYIQTIVDEKKLEGQFVITGSHQAELHEALAQSLAGRTALLQLLPLSFQELQAAGVHQTVDQWLLSGFYPRIYEKNINPTEMYRNYVKTYLERDVRKMINLKDLLVFQRFMKLCAARTGCVLNMHNLANEVGVSHHTIKHWLSILQASYLIELIPAYFENINKQIIKSPKLYFTDVGLVTYLLDIENISQVSRDPLRGNLFETMVVIDLIKTRLNQGRDPHLYFYRDSQKNEVDVIYKHGNLLIPIEIKSAQTIHKEFYKNLDYFKKLVGDRSGNAYLIYAGTEEIKLQNCELVNYSHADKIVTE
ncbi:MAG: ATP-binding protein [Proteobacteria bacterium]|nr:ATP-binding protein [Pseudomonadota bacterium]